MNYHKVTNNLLLLEKEEMFINKNTSIKYHFNNQGKLLLHRSILTKGNNSVSTPWIWTVTNLTDEKNISHKK